MPLKQSAVTNDQALRIYVADDQARRLNLKSFFGLNIRRDFALNDDGNGTDFPLQDRLLTDRDAGLPNDLTLNFSINGRRSIKLQFTVDFCARSKIGPGFAPFDYFCHRRLLSTSPRDFKYKAQCKFLPQLNDASRSKTFMKRFCMPGRVSVINR
jgi:hypothetical protein